MVVATVECLSVECVHTICLLCSFLYLFLCAYDTVQHHELVIFSWGMEDKGQRVIQSAIKELLFCWELHWLQAGKKKEVGIVHILSYHASNDFLIGLFEYAM